MTFDPYFLSVRGNQNVFRDWMKNNASLAERQLRLTVNQMLERATVVRVHHDAPSLGISSVVALHERLSTFKLEFDSPWFRQYLSG